MVATQAMMAAGETAVRVVHHHRRRLSPSRLPPQRLRMKMGQASRGDGGGGKQREAEVTESTVAAAVEPAGAQRHSRVATLPSQGGTSLHEKNAPQRGARTTQVSVKRSPPRATDRHPRRY